MNGKNGSKKFLFVSKIALAGDLAWQIKNEGHGVKFFISEKDSKDIYDGFVDKAEDWKNCVDWADVIVFDDVEGFGTEAEKLRKQGKLVVGGTSYTDKLEDDKGFGQDEMRDAGISVIPNWMFTNFDEAIKFIQKNPDRYVLKPSGRAQDEKELLFIGQEDDGKDMIQILQLYKKTWAKLIKEFQLQKFVTGVEVAVGAFFNGKEFIAPINVNFEHKRLFPGDIGPQTGEMGCYDDETEVLTRSGWKRFTDVAYEDEFATLNPQTDQLEFHRPSLIVHYAHHKKLLEIKNRATDLLVTLDHNMFGQEANSYRKGKQWGFVKAKDLPYQFVAPRSAKWIGEERPVFTLPSQPIFHYEGRAVAKKEAQAVLIPMDDWLAFLGLWLAEGWTTEKNHCIGICQINKKKLPAIEKALNNLPFKFKKNKNGWLCYNKQLWSYLRPLGNALNKFVPSEYKQLCVRQLNILFNSMCIGDGNLQKNGFRIYYTSSKKLADDVQEMLLKIGHVGIVKKRQARSGGIGTRKFKTTNPCFEVIERISKTEAWLDKRDFRTVDYEGNVHCVTVPYHTLYVRRNGKPVWCGNTAMYWSAPNIVFSETLEKMAPKLRNTGYVGYIDINCIVNAKGIYPLEFTCRFGYPHISIAMEGVTSPWGEFLYDIASGKPYELKVKKGFQIGVVIAVPPFPYDDAKSFKQYSADAVVLFRKNSTDGVHLGDVKLVDGDWILTGTIGYALVVTGSGTTTEEARKMAYNRVKNIMIPNMFYREDIGERLREDLDKLMTWSYIYVY